MRRACWRSAVLGSLLALLLPLAVEAQDAATRPPSPWLGVYLVDEVDGGIRIVAVVPGGPASVAGLRSGDLLIEAQNRQLADQAALERVLDQLGPDPELSVSVLRDGAARSFRLVPSARAPLPAAPPRVPEAPEAALTPRPWTPLAASGVRTVELTEELREHYGAPRDRGVLVVRVAENGLLAAAGVEVGDVVVGVGADPVTTPAEVSLALARRRLEAPLKLELVRDRSVLIKELPAAERPAAPSGYAAWSASTKQVRARQIERTIEMLERQLQALREQLAELEASAAETPLPANPDPE